MAAVLVVSTSPLLDLRIYPGLSLCSPYAPPYPLGAPPKLPLYSPCTLPMLPYALGRLPCALSPLPLKAAVLSLEIKNRWRATLHSPIYNIYILRSKTEQILARINNAPQQLHAPVQNGAAEDEDDQHNYTMNRFLSYQSSFISGSERSSSPLPSHAKQNLSGQALIPNIHH